MDLNPYLQVNGSEMQQWMAELLSILLEMLSDASSPEKRGVALWTLGQLVGSTGHVVKPYTQYPQLLDTLINFLKTEQQPIIRFVWIQSSTVQYTISLTNRRKPTILYLTTVAQNDGHQPQCRHDISYCSLPSLSKSLFAFEGDYSLSGQEKIRGVVLQ
uniref:Serine/threonine-protein kinase mTOR domain-containing protein n=1 Tax=Timema genevievae TaxID=629358 RepID=A0A7R9JR13_TIMGE|nr:unnamed protein product [Timema genevievae]